MIQSTLNSYAKNKHPLQTKSECFPQVNPEKVFL
ncbi:hypothetical protein H6G60_17855 [Coleofasciculus sp. FACHB-SPT36]|nr:hypothetical protein [Coleofasciculus sp. FACHB-SPT36]